MSSLPITLSRAMVALRKPIGTVSRSRMTPSTRARTSMSSARGVKWTSLAPSWIARRRTELTISIAGALSAESSASIEGKASGCSRGSDS